MYLDMIVVGYCETLVMDVSTHCTTNDKKIKEKKEIQSDHLY